MAIKNIFATTEEVGKVIDSFPILAKEPEETVYILESSDIDATLTQSGKVADAKAVGNKIDLIFDEIEKINRDSIIEEVIAALGTPVFGTVDENCNINLTGVLADGKTYTFTYEDENGNIATIGTYTKTAPPKYTNVLPLAINSDGTKYNDGQGWKKGYRLNSSGVEKEEAVSMVTGFIPVKYGDTVYLENIKWCIDHADGVLNGMIYIWCYDSNFNPLGYAYDYYRENDTPSIAEFDANKCLKWFIVNDEFINQNKNGSSTKVAYIRLNAEYISDDPIITVNQPIV